MRRQQERWLRLRRALGSGARWIGGIAGIVGLLGAWQMLDRPVAVVSVTGKLDGAQRALVEARVSEHIGGGILSLDLDELLVSLEEFDWLRGVSVRRVWPHELRVDANPVSAIARWNDDRMLGDDGRLHPVSSADTTRGLPRLTGPDAMADEILGTFVVLSDMATKSELTVVSAGVDARGEWVLDFMGGPTLHLGREDVLERAERALSLYARELKSRRRDVERVDARYADGISVKWRKEFAAVDSIRGTANGG